MNCKNLATLALVYFFMILKVKCANTGNSLEAFENHSITIPQIIDDYFEYLYQKVNEIELNNDKRNTRGSIKITRQYVDYYSGAEGQLNEELDLNETLIKAAVFGKRLDRLSILFNQMRHINLSDKNKVEISDLAIKNLEKSKSDDDRYVILNFLLFHTFQFDTVIHYESRCNKLYPVIEDPIAAKLFLSYDRNFFENIYECNFVQEAIKKDNFTAAAQILNYVLNPALVIDGKNALDSALSATKCVRVLENSESSESVKEKCREYEIKRRELIEILEKIPGLSESMTYENFKSACHENNSEIALRILESKALELNNNYNTKYNCKDESPLGAVLEIDDCNVIRKTLNIFLNKLTLDQLEKVQLSCENIYPIENIKPKKAVIKEVLQKVQNRIFFLNNCNYFYNFLGLFP